MTRKWKILKWSPWKYLLILTTRSENISITGLAAQFAVN